MKFTKDPKYEAAFVRSTDLDEPGDPAFEAKQRSLRKAAFIRAGDLDEPTPEELAFQAKRRTLWIRLGLGAVVLVIGGVAAVAAIELKRDTPAKQVARGVAYSKENSHISAILEFKRSLQEMPDQPDVRVLLGEELSKMADARGAEIEFQKAVDAKYDLETTLPLLVESMLHQGAFERVIAAINDSPLDSASANADLLAMRGSAYFALGRVDEAQTSWNAAKEFVPNHAKTLIAQARSFAARNEFAKADEILAGIPPDAPQVELLALRGELARATGKPEEALAAYEAGLKIEPSNLRMRTSLAETLLSLKRFDEASVEIKKVLKPTPRYAEAQYVAALVAVGKKDYASATDSAMKAVQLVPNDGRFQLLAGTLSMQAGNRAEAEQYLTAAVSLMPRNAAARRLLALIYVERNDSTKADQMFRPVFDTFRSDQEIAKIGARIALQQGNFTKAAGAFDLVDTTDPKNVDTALLAAAMKIKAGDKAGGFAKLRAAAAANPDNADVDAALVISHLTFNETNDASTDWKELARKEPAAARTANLLAAIQLARGDKAGARQSMQKAADADPHWLPPISGLALLDLGDKKVDDARMLLKRFVAANPMNADAVLLQAQIEQQNGTSNDRLIALLKDASKANPRSPRIAYALAARLVAAGDAAQAILVANAALAAAPDDIPLLNLVGEQSLATGDAEHAIAVYKRLQNLDAASADYPTSAGIALASVGQYEEALSAFRLSLGRNPNDVGRHFAMVGSLINAGRGGEAQRILYEIGRQSPRTPELGELDADVKLQLKQYPESITAYRKALAQQPSARLAIKTANALIVARQRGEAYTFLTDWMKNHPADEQVRSFDADIAMRAKDHPRAVADLRVLVAAHPGDPFLLNNLAWNLGQVGDPEAIAMAEKASALAPDNAAVSDTLGWMLVEKGNDAARGLALIEKASRAAPTELDIRLHLGRAQLKLGRNAAARATLESVISAAPASDQGKASQTLLASF